MLLVNQLSGFGVAPGGRLSAPQTKTASGTFVVPAGVTQLVIEGIGGGGGGGSGGGSTAGEGGGGGEYAKKTISVSPGASHNFTIGAAGASQGAGGDTIFYDTDGTTPLCVAKGGGAGLNAAPGAGGTGGTGDVLFAGGDGAPEAGDDTDGQGGGSAGGPTAAGNDGSGATGGASPGGTLADGVSGPGAGGNGGSGGGAGAIGGVYGGGSGGSDVGITGPVGRIGVMVLS